MKPTEGLWVRSDLASNGTYIVSVSLDEDFVMPLTPDDAVAYACNMIRGAERALYDAAVMRQFTTKVGLTVEHAAQVISDLRAERPSADIAPLTFTPGVNSDGKPFLVINLHGEPHGQVTPAALLAHAANVLSAITVADLDNTYLKVLKSMSIGDGRARNVVDDLINWRVDGTE